MDEYLAERVGESASVDIADGDSVLSLDQVIGAASVTSVNWAGKRTPMHATSSGKIFLAFMPSEQRAAYFERPGQRFTEHTITGRRELEAELAQVRDQGYAATMEEFEIGLGDARLDDQFAPDAGQPPVVQFGRDQAGSQPEAPEPFSVEESRLG